MNEPTASKMISTKMISEIVTFIDSFGFRSKLTKFIIVKTNNMFITLLYSVSLSKIYTSK